ncbi:MAG TPA: class I SAM-dependent methyltransferase [Anaerolineales bacterium]|nr:class I SAM-dependent methyltransferase [Anaerolineales bacterium]
MGRRFILPGQDIIHETSSGDPVDYYYHPLYGLIYRRRLALALDLLGGDRVDRILEIGYGSGILLPELSRRARRLDGLDRHEELGGVRRMLEKLGVEATLRVGDIHDLPYEEGEFNTVVCLSVLEHLTDLDRACGEIDRVLAPDGAAIVGFPVANALTSALFRWLGYRAKEIHPSSHTQILAALRRRFDLSRMSRLPALVPLPLGLYVACRCQKL